LFLWCDGEKDAEARVGNVEGGRRTRKLDWRQWCERERERERERGRERDQVRRWSYDEDCAERQCQGS
jgi:capsid protein